MLKAICLFLLAGLAEIGGGYLIWQGLREDQSAYLGLFGDIALALYAVIATFQTFPSFGRVYAAYGGVFSRLSWIRLRLAYLVMVTRRSICFFRVIRRYCTSSIWCYCYISNLPILWLGLCSLWRCIYHSFCAMGVRPW